MGTAELAVASLRALAGSKEYQVVAVVTQPDRPQGRKLQLQPSPVKAAALELGLTVLQPEKLRAEASQQALRELAPDLIVVAAYGQILPQSILDLPRYGCLNVHTSLLPRHRGAAPIQWAILNGDAETGVTLMLMDAGLDTGPMLRQRSTVIVPEDTAITLHDRLARLGAELLKEVIPLWVGKTLQPTPQPATGVTYARKIEKQDGALVWHLPAIELWNRVRGLVPWPGAFFARGVGEQATILKVWEASPEPAESGSPGDVLESGPNGVLVRCGSGALRLKLLQREGGKRLPAREFLAGCPIPAGERFPLPASPSA